MAISALAAQAAKMAAKIANNPAVRKVAAKGAALATLWVAERTGDSALDKLKERQVKQAAANASSETDQEALALALDLARQIDAQYSEGIVVDGARRHIVWRDGKPIACFPELDDKPSPAVLAKRPELEGLADFLIKNPPRDTNISE